MANPTSNFGWQMPTSTDLVTDLPADFEVFGQAVDTTLVDLKGGTSGQVLAKASNTDMDFTWTAIDPLVILDAKGDLISATAADTPARLAVGANDTVLTADSSTATGLKWAAPSVGGANWSLLNSGGTLLTGATTITVSGISGADQIMVLIASASAGADAQIKMRFNADTGSNYFMNGIQLDWSPSYNASNYGSYSFTDSEIYLGNLSSNASSIFSGGLQLTGCNAAGVKMWHHATTGNPGGSTGHTSRVGYGSWNNSATVTSVSLISSSGNFDAGRIYVYTTA
jgi:hypothetical protein